MPKVECLQLPGLTCWFWSNDHDPPHFHVKRAGEWELRVLFAEGAARMFDVKWGAAPTPGRSGGSPGRSRLIDRS